MSDIKIFVSHRIDLDSEIINNSLYYNVRCGAIYDKKTDVTMVGDDTGDNISEKRLSYCELTVQYWAWKNIKADYYGLCHYRRYLSFSEAKGSFERDERNNGCVSADYISEKNIERFNLTENKMRDLIEQYDVVIAEPINLKTQSSARDNFDAMQLASDYHNMEDVYKAIDIIRAKYPHMVSTAERYMRGATSWLYNCFIMKANIFEDYSAWLFDILFELENKIDMSHYSLKMYRTPGTIAERLLGIYITYLMEQKKYRIFQTPLVFFENVQKPEILSPVFSDKSVVIVSNFNNNYIPVFSTFLLSALEHFDSGYNYEIIVLSQDIADISKKQIEYLISGYQNIVVRYYNPKWILADTPLFVDNNVYTEEMYFRVIVPYILQNYEKALIIDADTICKTDLSELYQTDVTGYLAAAVKDTVFQGYLNGAVPDTLEYTKNTMKLTDPYNYCNTGVILMNLREIRKKYTLEDTIHFMKSRRFRIYEQDMLNVLYDGCLKFLDQSWNVYTYTNSFVGMCIDLAPMESKQLYLAARESPRIIHYASHPKPWTAGEADFSIDFWRIARNSPYYEVLISRLVDSRMHNGVVPDNRSFIRKLADKLLPYGSRRRAYVKRLIMRSK